MLWSAFLAQVRRELEESSAVVWSDDSFLYWANEASKDIAIQTKCSRDWQYTTAIVGQSSYDLPDRSLDVLEVYFGDPTTIGARVQLSRQDFNDWYELDATSGTPVYYAIDDDNLFLYPPPDHAYEISYFRYTYPASMTAGTDSMPYEDKYNNAISYFLKFKAKEQIDDWDGSDRFYDRYLREIDKIQSQEMKESHSSKFIAPASVW